MQFKIYLTSIKFPKHIYCIYVCRYNPIYLFEAVMLLVVNLELLSKRMENFWWNSKFHSLHPWDWDRRAASDERLEEGRKGDGKFENEDKCFKVCVFVEKGDVVGESWCYHCHMNSVLFYGFVPLPFVTSGVFCMVEIIPCLDFDGLKHRVGTSVIYDSWSKN